jgi:hypothetical protein
LRSINAEQLVLSGISVGGQYDQAGIYIGNAARLVNCKNGGSGVAWVMPATACVAQWTNCNNPALRVRVCEPPDNSSS